MAANLNKNCRIVAPEQLFAHTLNSRAAALYNRKRRAVANRGRRARMYGPQEPEVITVDNQKKFRGRSVIALFCSSSMVLNMGGCPDLREGVVDAFESSTLAYVSDSSSSGPQGVLERGIVGTFVRAFYDRLRNPTTP